MFDSMGLPIKALSYTIFVFIRIIEWTYLQTETAVPTV